MKLIFRSDPLESYIDGVCAIRELPDGLRDDMVVLIKALSDEGSTTFGAVRSMDIHSEADEVRFNVVRGEGHSGDFYGLRAGCRKHFQDVYPRFYQYLQQLTVELPEFGD